ncbi:Hypothetical protein FKW44_003399 [Caligus rogercresseyi]|uniref:Uncharacterized protein n=1 Tax=Caligus rogercresseyi TaxID=217165 RepID=A0A7T8KLK2_CALRO|nr:Hypothetical protein FKW44_003399 [Caligus rogercresseyi]
MRRAVVYPPIRRRPLFRGGGGSTCPSSTHPEAAGHAMKIPPNRPCMELGRDSHPPHTQEGGPNTTTASPALASLFTSL